MADENSFRLPMDKCTVQYNMKIPECLADEIKKLSDTEKRAMKERMIIEMARACHNRVFDPMIYLKSE